MEIIRLHVTAFVKSLKKNLNIRKSVRNFTIAYKLFYVQPKGGKRQLKCEPTNLLFLSILIIR